MSTVTFNGYDLSKLIKVHWDIDPEILPAVDDRTTTVGDRNGSLFLHRRIGERVITMDYTMLNADEAKRQELTRVLNVSEPKQLILGKQPDRYYMAMPKGDISRGTKGWNDWSTIDWIVYEPYAHALTPTTATNENSDGRFADTITLTNNGTVPTPVNIETEFDHDNGYFAASLDDRYYQIGHPDEIDVVDYKQNETLIHDSYASDDELSSYTKNNALHRYNPTGTHQQGAFKTAVVGTDKRSVLQVSNTGPLVQGWQGPSLTRVIPKDSNGALGVLNPALEVYIDFYATNNLQSGILEVNLTDANDKFVAGVLFRKPATSNKHIEVTFYAGDKEVWSAKSDAKWDNFRGRVSIYKFNNHFWFGLSKLERGKDNHTVSFNYYDDTLKDLTATKYHIWASHWQDQKFMMIQIYDIKLTKQNVEKQANVANFFSPGDKLLINSSEYKSYINDVVDLDDVATGSKPLMLPANSTTTLALATSSFGHLRKVTATFRERWI